VAICILNTDVRKIRLAPHFPERNSLEVLRVSHIRGYVTLAI